MTHLDRCLDHAERTGMSGAWVDAARSELERLRAAMAGVLDLSRALRVSEAERRRDDSAYEAQLRRIYGAEITQLHAEIAELRGQLATLENRDTESDTLDPRVGECGHSATDWPWFNNAFPPPLERSK